MLKQYIEYLKDNPEGYWFKARAFGWGWAPVSWQGWLVVIIYIGIIVVPGVFLADSVETGEEYLGLFPLIILISTTVLFWICYKKGERPRWSWGIPKKVK
jgi:hypothetical protein